MDKIIAVFGGGFKPPTAGHFEVVKRALEEFPEIDEFIIYVGGGERDGITQVESILIWEIYQTYLPINVKIEPSKTPIGDIIRLGKNNPQDTVYFIIGAREKNEGDLKDIESRTKGVEEKYPNMKIKVISTPDGGMSGTNARKAAKVSPEELYKYLPSELKNEEKEEVYNLVSPVIKEKKDPKTGTGKKPKGSGRRLYTDEDPKDTVGVKFSSRQDIVDTLNKTSFKNKSHARQSQIINLIHQRVRAAYNRAKDPDVKKRLKTALDYAEQRKEASKAKTQRLKKQKNENVAPNHDGKATPFGSGYDEVKEQVNFKALEKQLDNMFAELDIDVAFTNHFKERVIERGLTEASFEEYNYAGNCVTGLDDPYFQRNVCYDATEMAGIVDEFSNEFIQADEFVKKVNWPSDQLGPAEDTIYDFAYNKDKDIYWAYHIDNDVHLFFVKDVISEIKNPNDYITVKDVTDFLYDDVKEQVNFKALEKQLDNMFAELDIDVAFTNHFKERVIERGLTEEDIIELTNKIIDKYPNELDFLDKNQNIVMSHLSRLVDIAAINTGYGDDYLKDLVFKTAFKRKDKSEPEFRTNKSSPRLVVNEYSMGDSIDLLPYLSKLTQHMINKGYNIKPLPKLELIDDDIQNAADFLGKTAYYDPNTQTIVLYTCGRHPKDIARSYAHEMIHHIQNLEGRLGGITTTNTTEDSNLENIEKEAYLNGNITFRNWTDSLNENILPQEKFAQETGQDYIQQALKNTPQKSKYNIKDYRVVTLPLDKVKPTQFDEDYINPSSEYEAEQYKKYIEGKIGVEDLRKEDFYPIIVDKDTMEIIDGNHRHAVHKMLGIPKIKAILISKNLNSKARKILNLNENLTQDIPQYFYHATYKPLLPSIKKTGLDTSKAKLAWEDSEPGVVYLANDPYVAESYAEASEMVDDEWLDQIIILKVASKDLDLSKLHDDRNVRNDEPSDTFEYHGVIPWNVLKLYKEDINEKVSDKNMDDYKKSNNPSGKIKDLFGLNQYARELVQEIQAPIIQTQLRNKYSEVLEKLFLFPSKDGKYMELNLIKIKPEFKGKGWATKILNDLVIWAKENNVILTLTPSSTFGANEKRLTKFYKSFGFQPNKGKNRDFQTRDNMILKEGRYDKLVNQLSRIAFEAIKDGYNVGRKVLDLTFTVGPDGEDIISNDFDFDFNIEVEYTEDEYKVDGGANAGYDDKGEEIIPLLTVRFKIPKKIDWQTVSFDLKDVIRHELEHLTQDGENVKPGKQTANDQFIRKMIDADLLPKAEYFKLEKEVDAMLQGLYFKAKKSKRPYIEVIDDYLDKQPISQKEREDILDVWRKRAKSLSLPLFEAKYKLGNVMSEQEVEQKYKIYCDMDGVLTNFDTQFEKLSGGISPREYEERNGKDAFWSLISQGGVGFWVGMPWMPNGKQLWEYISKYNPTILSAPSKENESRLGKRLWVRNNLKPKPKLILASASNKPNYSGRNKILIDDRPDTIENWKSKGGIGILFKSTEQVIKELQELGL